MYVFKHTAEWKDAVETSSAASHGLTAPYIHACREVRMKPEYI